MLTKVQRQLSILLVCVMLAMALSPRPSIASAAPLYVPDAQMTCDTGC